MSLLDISECPPFWRYDGTITDRAKAPSHGSQEAKTLCLAALREDYFLPFYDGDTELLSAASGLIRRWTDTFATQPFQQNLRSAWRRIRDGHEPDSELEQAVLDLLATRPERWGHLAAGIGIEVPTSFRLYRGVHGDDFVRHVVEAWRDPTGPEEFFIPHHELASWTMRRTAAVKQFAKNPVASVVFEAEVQFENTFLDKWVDDSAFLVPWWHQFEMVVGIDEPDTLPVLRKAAVVYYKHHAYSFEQHETLIAHWDKLN